MCEGPEGISTADDLTDIQIIQELERDERIIAAVTKVLKNRGE